MKKIIFKFINLFIRLFVYLGFIDKSKILILQPSVTDVKNLSGYVYKYSYLNSNYALSNSFLVFSNPTIAIYTLILFCITYRTFDIKCCIVGYVDKNGEFYKFRDVNYLDFFSVSLAYHDYKRKYGDVTDVPFSQIEAAVVQLIFVYLDFSLGQVFDMDKDKFITDTVEKYNITSFKNQDIIDKYLEHIKKHIPKSDIKSFENKEVNDDTVSSDVIDYSDIIKENFGIKE